MKLDQPGGFASERFTSCESDDMTCDETEDNPAANKPPVIVITGHQEGYNPQSCQGNQLGESVFVTENNIQHSQELYTLYILYIIALNLIK